MILFSERSLRRALSNYVDHFHAERNHQGKGNILLFPRTTDRHREGQCRERLAGSCATIIARRRDGASVGSVFWPYGLRRFRPVRTLAALNFNVGGGYDPAVLPGEGIDGGTLSIKAQAALALADGGDAQISDEGGRLFR